MNKFDDNFIKGLRNYDGNKKLPIKTSLIRQLYYGFNEL